MKLESYTFVALDLETTGLSHEKDTIIEIAAVKFSLVKTDGKYSIVNVEEHSQLIDPDRELTKEISMITGITQDMLIGKQKWKEVQKKVEDFIGDAIIVGHNVLFDTAMLATHGIDLSENIVLDTFELSEIFSQEAESLNLAFLAKHYGIEIIGEHRALDDTKLSIELFLKYLEIIQNMNETIVSFWEFISKKDDSHTIPYLLAITERKSGIFYKSEFSQKDYKEQQVRKIIENKSITTLVNLTGRGTEEIDTILSKAEKDTTLLLVTNGQKQSMWMYEKIKKFKKEVHIYREADKFISFETIEGFLEKSFWNRKETILLAKLDFWLRYTKTGLLDELKFYGDERIWLELFRATQDEENPFIETARGQEKGAEILISDLQNKELFRHTLRRKLGTIIFRDALSVEKNIRKQQSKKISFSECMQRIENSETLKKYEEIRDDLIMAFGCMSSIVDSVVSRPTGPNPLPPGDFGETYFFTQEELWNRGKKWLPLYGKLLGRHQKSIETLPFDTLEKKEFIPVLKAIDALVDIIYIGNSNLSLLSHIGKEGVSLSIIPKNISSYTKKLLEIQNAEKVTIMGYGIDGEISEKFLQNECGFIFPREEKVKKERTPIEIFSKLQITQPKTVILSTSLKHLREITQKLKNTQGIETIYTQGLSGGKGKMLSLFRRNEKKSVLLGLIDTWTDESNLWKITDMVYIMKIPFDPPSDPYFLARTNGMKNNFEEYSTPLAISTINTLLGRILSANPESKIRFSDERIEKMSWGKMIESEIISL